MKKTRFLVSIFIILSAFLVVTGCKHDNGFTEGDDSPIKKMNISDAKTLYVGSSTDAGRSAGLRAAGEADTLMKIKDDGSIEKVSYYDEDGKPITVNYRPSVITPVNDDYLLIAYTQSTSDAFAYFDYSYLVRKSDEACFDLGPLGRVVNVRTEDRLGNGKLVYADAKNNIYLAIENELVPSVVKIDLAGIDSLTCQVLTGKDSVLYFAADNDGNIIYADNSYNYKVKNAETGAITRFGDEVKAMWKGIDGKLYCYQAKEDDPYPDPQPEDLENDWGKMHAICRIDFDTKGKADLAETGRVVADIRQYDSRSVYLKDKIIIFSHDGQMIEVYNENMTPRKIKFSDISIDEFEVVSANDNYFYAAGSEKNGKCFLLQVDPKTDEYKHMLDQDRYQVYSFTVANDGTITFNAEDGDTGKIVLGEVKEDEEPEILSEDSPVIKVIQRIN